MSGTLPEQTISEAQVTQLIESLQGTCGGLDNALAVVLGVEDADYSLMPDWALGRLDNAIFNCDGCGWWCEASDNNEGLCSDCN